MGGGFTDSDEFVCASDGCGENGDGADVAFGLEFADAFEDAGYAFALGVDKASA